MVYISHTSILYIGQLNQSCFLSSKSHTLKNLIKISQSVDLYTYNLLKESFKINQYYIILWLPQGKTSETN